MSSKVTEFGNVFDVSTQMMETQDFERLVLDTVLRHYQEAKRDNFPEWKGFPEIRSTASTEGNLKVTWYAAVPSSLVFFNSEKEEELWDE